MKTNTLMEWLKFLTVVTALIATDAFCAGVPDYRGKVILVVDRTIGSDLTVSNKLFRLTDDLVGDGWRVLRRDVDRGGTPGTPEWAAQVRVVRALIKGYYDASLSDPDPSSRVKSVFLVGHVAVPYSGFEQTIVGGHVNWAGAHPADTFYGEMTTPYGDGVFAGWSDSHDWNTPFPNDEGDGRFDRHLLPSPMELAVGRLDLSNMEAFHGPGIGETNLIARYLDKNHDFRIGDLKTEGGILFPVKRRAILGVWTTAACPQHDKLFSADNDAMNSVFGSANVHEHKNSSMHWFPNVDQDGEDYLLGYGGGYGWEIGPPGIGSCAAGIGATMSFDDDFEEAPWVHPSIESQDNNFVDKNSRAIFTYFFASFCGDWNRPNNLLKAPLANPYDPTSGRYGYGLTALWSGYTWFGLDFNTLSKEAMGATVGEALFAGWNGVLQGGIFNIPFGGSVNMGLMGDPTLRWHVVRPPSGLASEKTATTFTLNWNHSPDATGYRIYRAPTRNGPYTLVTTVGYVTTHGGSRPVSTDPAYPDNFYMVRAIKTETTPVGSYENMSVGAIAKLPGGNPAYLKINSQPASLAVKLGAPAAFAVEALGINAVGNERITYQWWKNGVAISANDPRIGGANSNAITITNVQAGDIGSYSAVLNVVGIQRTTATATLAIKTPPVAVDDSFTVYRNTPTDLHLLANDSDSDDTLSTLSLVIPQLDVFNDPDAISAYGSFALNGQVLHYVPSQRFLGLLDDPSILHYVLDDGAGAAWAVFNILVVPNPTSSPPIVSLIGNQVVSQFGTLDLSFTISDDFTSPEDLEISVSFSNPTMINPHYFSIVGTGASRVLHIKAGAVPGSGTVTLKVKDEDLDETTITFTVTVNPHQVPALLATGFSESDFEFTIYGTAGVVVDVQKSDDYVSWTSLGQVTVSANNTYVFTDTGVGAATRRYYRASRSGYGCSPNSIGFAKRVVPPFTPTPCVLDECQDGGFLISNPFNNPAGNTVGVLFSDVPTETSCWLIKWDAGTQSPCSLGFFAAHYTVWGPSIVTLDPGEGAMFQNRSANPLTLTFIGDVPIGTHGISLVPGFSLVSSVNPKALPLGSLNLPSELLDEIHRFNPSTQEFESAAIFDGTEWVDNSNGNPIVVIPETGEGFFYFNAGTTIRTWTQNVFVCPP